MLQIRDRTIGIIGVENYSANPRFQKYGDMAVATEGMDRSDFTILLSHDPSHWKDGIIKEYPYIDLTLSGHTHGFQFGIEMGSFFKWSPVKYVYKEWAGLYQEGSQYLYVNRGLGFLGYPGRVGILPEITCIDLRSESNTV
jgi:predicted MPP superfamily phosphohydrolase